MCARCDVSEKALGMVEFSLLPSYSSQMFFDDGGSLKLVSMKYQANIRQADSHTLACSQHPQATKMFLAVIAVARQQAIRHYNTHVVPMSQNMGRNIELVRRISDLHPPMIAH